MKEPSKGTQHNIFRCMTSKIADADIDIRINGFEVSMKCIGSGATYIKAAFSSALVFLAYYY